LAGDHAGSWKAFLDNAGIHLPEGMFEAMFAHEPDPQAIADTHYQNTHMLRPTTHFQPDITALRTAATRIVVGIGETSAGQLCDRTSRALATALGTEPTMFPGGHIGFAEDPGGFATRLRLILQQGCPARTPARPRGQLTAGHNHRTKATKPKAFKFRDEKGSLCEPTREAVGGSPAPLGPG